MEWLKRNLFFIGWGALALGLTVLAFFFLFTETGRDNELHDALEQKRRELESFYRANPQPSLTNINRVKADQERVHKLLADARKQFTAPVLEKVDSAAFKKLLEETVSQLKRDAQAARVSLPQNYSFTFAVQRTAVQFSPGSLEPLVARMHEIKTLCRILYDARVHSLDGLRRASVAADDSDAASDILVLSRPTTNQVAAVVAHPYEITFTGFSRELGAVLDALQREPICFIVNSLAIEPAPALGAPASPVGVGGVPAAAVAPPAQSAPAADSDAPRPPPAQPAFALPTLPRGAAPARQSGPVTILDEKLIRVTLTLDAVLPLPAK